MNIINRLIIGGLLALSMILPATSALAAYNNNWFNQKCTYNAPRLGTVDPAFKACTEGNRSRCLAANRGGTAQDLARCPGGASAVPSTPAAGTKDTDKNTPPSTGNVVFFNNKIVPSGVMVPRRIQLIDGFPANGGVWLRWLATKDVAYKLLMDESGTGDSSKAVDITSSCTPIVIVGATANCLKTGLTNGKNYFFFVKAVNNKGEAPASNYSGAVTPSDKLQPPGVYENGKKVFPTSTPATVTQPVPPAVIPAQPVAPAIRAVPPVRPAVQPTILNIPNRPPQPAPCVPNIFKRCPTTSLPGEANTAATGWFDWLFGR